MKNLINFFKNSIVLLNLLLAFGGLFLLFTLTFLALRVYTHHGQALTVPEFSGLNLNEVSKLADQKKLRYQIIDSVYVRGQAPGTVLSQNPSPGTKVKTNRSIFLTINAFNPEKTSMPNVVGVSIRQAEAILQSFGLKVGLKKYIPDVAKDYVLHQQYQNQEIAPGSKIIKGSDIDLVMGLGLGDTEVNTPELKRLTKTEAQEILSNNYLNIGALIYDSSVESLKDSMKAVIWKQVPDYGTPLKAGSSIDIWLTADKPDITPDTTIKDE